ncbi:membrane protein [Streptomyces spiroverticillatus]|uniref:Membrane protein n=1 Tax=Streptomyces finlayi TaxID=67296 RepID=A0A919CAC6_9ACTN|nr:membrane protein [Streptomyces spiroverticillatus]GHC94068.1 membrane protein [Streptomyces finlayi]
MVRKLRGAEVVRITGARQGLAEDVRGRQRRYVISMAIRTVAVILAAVLWNVERPVAIVALALGVLLPYVAVVIANGGRENAKPLPSTFVPAPVRPAIGPPLEGTVMGPDEGPFRDAEAASNAAGPVNEPRGRTT